MFTSPLLPCTASAPKQSQVYVNQILLTLFLGPLHSLHHTPEPLPDPRAVASTVPDASCLAEGRDWEAMLVRSSGLRDVDCLRDALDFFRKCWGTRQIFGFGVFARC